MPPQEEQPEEEEAPAVSGERRSARPPKAVPESWPPWIHRTAEALDRGRAVLPPGQAMPQGPLPPGLPSSAESEVHTQRLWRHLLYRYSERAVHAATFRPDRWAMYVMGRPVQARWGLKKQAAGAVPLDPHCEPVAPCGDGGASTCAPRACACAIGRV